MPSTNLTLSDNQTLAEYAPVEAFKGLLQNRYGVSPDHAALHPDLQQRRRFVALGERRRRSLDKDIEHAPGLPRVVVVKGIDELLAADAAWVRHHAFFQAGCCGLERNIADVQREGGKRIVRGLDFRLGYRKRRGRLCLSKVTFLRAFFGLL